MDPGVEFYRAADGAVRRPAVLLSRSRGHQAVLRRRRRGLVQARGDPAGVPLDRSARGRALGAIVGERERRVRSTTRLRGPGSCATGRSSGGASTRIPTRHSRTPASSRGDSARGCGRYPGRHVSMRRFFPERPEEERMETGTAARPGPRRVRRRWRRWPPGAPAGTGTLRRFGSSATEAGRSSPMPRWARPRSEIAAGPDQPRRRGGRSRLHPGQHASGVVALRPRRRQRRRRLGADLPDELAGGVRVGRRQLGGEGDRLRERRPGGEDPRGAGEPPRPREHRRDRPAAASRSGPSRSTTFVTWGATATAPPSSSGSPASSPRTPTRSSTRRGRPARPRAACSRTATGARSAT